MSLRRSLAALCAATALTASAAQAASFALQPGEFTSELTGGTFSTNTWFGDSEDRLGIGGRLEQRVVRSHTELGWRKSASVWIDLPFVSRTYASDGGGTVTNTGLGDLGLGLRFGGRPFSIGLGWTGPTGGNRRLFPGVSGDGLANASSYETLASSALPGGGAFASSGLQSLSVTGSLGGRLGRSFSWSLGGGYARRFLNVSEMGNADRWGNVAMLSSSVSLDRGKALTLGLDGQQQWLRKHGDSYDGRTGLNVLSSSLQVGGRVIVHVDEKTDVQFGAWTTPAGQNVLHQNTFQVGLVWKSLGGAKGAKKPAPTTPAKR